jgi:hypothetical protein
VDTGMSDTERSQKYHHEGRQEVSDWMRSKSLFSPICTGIIATMSKNFPGPSSI